MMSGAMPSQVKSMSSCTVLDPAGSFLSVSTGELVSDLRDPHRPHTDLRELVSIHVEGQHDLVDDPGLRIPQESTCVSLCISLGLALKFVIILRQCDSLTNDDVLS